MTDHDDDFLDDIFAQARSVAPAPSDDLVARVLAGATVAAPQAFSAPRRSLGARLLDALGGWPTVGGLVTATCAGIWIGVAPPATLQDYTAAYFGDEVSLSILSEGTYFAAGDLIDG